MCLDAIKNTRTIRKPLRVFKVIMHWKDAMGEDAYMSPYMSTPLQLGLNEVPPKQRYIEDNYGGPIYTAGFHTYLARSGCSVWRPRNIAVCEIPAGTRIIEGIERTGRKKSIVIVSPTINILSIERILDAK